jgi:hypothetical protein
MPRRRCDRSTDTNNSARETRRDNDCASTGSRKAGCEDDTAS